MYEVKITRHASRLTRSRLDPHAALHRPSRPLSHLPGDGVRGEEVIRRAIPLDVSGKLWYNILGLKYLSL
jgi:hypothetical protein